MIAQALDRKNYNFILETELFLMHRQGINPYTLEPYMSMWEYQNFMIMFLQRIEEDQKELHDKNNILVDLARIRDILLFMKLPGHKNALS